MITIIIYNKNGLSLALINPLEYRNMRQQASRSIARSIVGTFLIATFMAIQPAYAADLELSMAIKNHSAKSRGT